MAFSRACLGSDLSKVNAFARVTNAYTFSGFQDVDLEKCGVDALWLSNQLRGWLDDRGVWTLRGNRGHKLFWRRHGETRWRCVTRRWTPYGE